MANTCDPATWRDLFMMLGGSAASLVGLLVIVVSLYDIIVRSVLAAWAPRPGRGAASQLLAAFFGSHGTIIDTRF